MNERAKGWLVSLTLVVGGLAALTLVVMVLAYVVERREWVLGAVAGIVFLTWLVHDILYAEDDGNYLP